MKNLKIAISELAQDFAEGVLSAIRSASLDEILGEGRDRAPKTNGRAQRPAVTAPPASARKRGGRLARRSEEEVAAISDKIIGLLKDHPEGLRAEQIRTELDLEAKEL